MTEFLSRMGLQREILSIVNSRAWSENLFGLSQSAISRWQIANRVSEDSEQLALIVAASTTLRFLATKSQDQVSTEYERIADDARVAARALKAHFEQVTHDGDD